MKNSNLHENIITVDYDNNYLVRFVERSHYTIGFIMTFKS